MVRQYHYTGWPDVGTPDSGSGLVDLIGHVRSNRSQETLQSPCIAGMDRVLLLPMHH